MKPRVLLLSLVMAVPVAQVFASNSGTEATACVDCEISKTSTSAPLNMDTTKAARDFTRKAAVTFTEEKEKTIAQKIIERDRDRFLSPAERARRQAARMKEQARLQQLNPEDTGLIDLEIDEKVLPRLDAEELAQILRVQGLGRDRTLNIRFLTHQDYKDYDAAQQALAKARFRAAFKMALAGPMKDLRTSVKEMLKGMKPDPKTGKDALTLARENPVILHEETGPKSSVLLSDWEAGKEERETRAKVAAQTAEAEAKVKERETKGLAVTETILDNVSLSGLTKGLSVGKDNVRVRIYQQSTSDRMIQVSVEKHKDAKPAVHANFSKHSDSGVIYGGNLSLQKTAQGKSNHGVVAYVRWELNPDFEICKKSRSNCQ